jgi:hypothetical protein
MTRASLADRYRLMWGKTLPDTLPEPVPPPDLGQPLYQRRPLDERALRLAWEDARTRVELFMHAAQVPLGEFIYHPHFEALEYLILNHWDRLGQPAVLQAALRLIGKMRDHPAAPMLAYEYLKIALGLGGEPWLPAQVADEQLAFMAAHELWQRFRGGPRADDPDDAPDVIDAEAVVGRD